MKGADGALYWHNCITKVSTYEKPAELQSAAEKADAATGWKEFKDADGKPYFHHKERNETVWRIPEELAKAREMLRVVTEGGKRAAERAMAGLAPEVGPPVLVPAPAPAAASALPVAGGAAIEVNTKAEYANKAEARAAFEAALADAGVRSTDSWEKVSRLASADGRWHALPSNAERRHVAKEWQERRRKPEAAEARKTEMANRKRFAELLDATPALKPRMSVREAEAVMRDDARFDTLRSALAHETRADIYLDWAADAAAKAEAKARAARGKAREAFRALCDAAFQATGGLDGEGSRAGDRHRTREASWRRQRQALDAAADAEARRLAEAEGAEDVASAMASMSALERMEVYEDVVRGAYEVDERQRAGKRGDARRRDRKARCAFLALLDGRRGKDEPIAAVSWASVLSSLRGSTEYGNMLLTESGSTPRELFEDVRQDALDALVQLRGEVAKELENRKIGAGSGTLIEGVAEVRAALGGSANKLLSGWAEADLALALEVVEVVPGGAEAVPAAGAVAGGAGGGAGGGASKRTRAAEASAGAAAEDEAEDGELAEDGEVVEGAGAAEDASAAAKRRRRA